jgi:hypothetical protein
MGHDFLTPQTTMTALTALEGPDTSELNELLDVMKKTLAALGSTFDALGQQTTKVASLAPAMDSAYQVSLSPIPAGTLTSRYPGQLSPPAAASSGTQTRGAYSRSEDSSPERAKGSDRRASKDSCRCDDQRTADKSRPRAGVGTGFDCPSDVGERLLITCSFPSKFPPP